MGAWLGPGMFHVERWAQGINRSITKRGKNSHCILTVELNPSKTAPTARLIFAEKYPLGTWVYCQGFGDISITSISLWFPYSLDKPVPPAALGLLVITC